MFNKILFNSCILNTLNKILGCLCLEHLKNRTRGYITFRSKDIVILKSTHSRTSLNKILILVIPKIITQVQIRRLFYILPRFIVLSVEEDHRTIYTVQGYDYKN